MRVTTMFAAGVGAVAMFFLDPARGRARRVQLRDRTGHAARVVRQWTRGVSQDWLNRANGLLAQCGERMVSQHPSDDVLVERVRSKLGHVLRHPHQVEVTADAGWVRLKGQVLPGEKEELIAAVGRIAGVFAVEDDLLEQGWLAA